MTKKQRITELTEQIKALTDENELLVTETRKRFDVIVSQENQIKDLTKRNRCNATGVERLSDATNHTINRLLRQNVSKMTHSERNHQNNRIASELIQILRIVNDITDMEDIPF